MRHLPVMLVLLFAGWSSANPLEETRYCGPPARYADGTIKRSNSVRRAFAKLYPCPASGQPITSCPGWAIDHVIPLACGGCDSVSNMQWLPNELKSAPVTGKDRFERQIYCTVKTANP